MSMLSAKSDIWITRRLNDAPIGLRLFCFPYAGGGSITYQKWAGMLPAKIEVCAVQLPGRERRHAEPPFRRISQAVDCLSSALRPHLDVPFVFFGHRMGAVLAYEVARRLLTDPGHEPRYLFVSWHQAPHLPQRKRPLHDLPNDEFLAELKALNGTPPEVFEHQELMELIMPLLRADFELADTYAELAGPHLSCPIMAMGGEDDIEVLVEDIATWSKATKGPFKLMLFKGDHFFINTERERLLKILKSELMAGEAP